MYALVPAINGVPDVGTIKVIAAYSKSDGQAYANLQTDVKSPKWEEIIDPEIIAKLTPKQEPAKPTAEELQGKMLANLTMEVAKINAKLNGGA